MATLTTLLSYRQLLGSAFLIKLLFVITFYLSFINRLPTSNGDLINQPSTTLLDSQPINPHYSNHTRLDTNQATQTSLHTGHGYNLQSEYTTRSLETQDNQETYQLILQYLLFFLFVFFSAAILQWLISKVPTYSVPVSIIWFLYGMVSYAVCKALPEDFSLLQKAILDMRQVDSAIVYYVMLPILLYEATQGINWFKFKRFIIGGLSLAVLGVFLQVAFLGVLFFFTFMRYKSESQWEASFLIASCLASTDPVAVLSVLSNVGAPEKLTTMIDGESLINDGSSVLLFQFFLYLTSGYFNSISDTILMLVQLLFLGPLFGFVLGMTMYSWIILFRKHHFTQCMATVTICYLGYFISEVYLGFSGPLTAVCYGLFVNAYGRIALDREAQEKHLHFVEGLGLLANCSLFMVSGIVAYGMMSSMFHEAYLINWAYLLLTYFYLTLARILMILIFLPVIKKIGYGINWKEVILLHWGGLRGGISLALALRIERDPNIANDISTEAAFYISANVLLILILQGTTFEAVYRLLNPYPPKPFRKVYLERVMKVIDYQYLKELHTLESHWLFQGTDVLKYADKVVPRLGWRNIDRLGNLTIKAPDIGLVLEEVDNCYLDDWQLMPNFYESSAAIIKTDSEIKPSPDSKINQTKNIDTHTDTHEQRHTLELRKFAHRLAALGQGLKSRDSVTLQEGPLFNPKFNLRLIERATYDDSVTPISRSPSLINLLHTHSVFPHSQQPTHTKNYTEIDEEGEEEVEEEYDPPMATSRLDTDATIVLPTIKQHNIRNNKTHTRKESIDTHYEKEITNCFSGFFSSKQNKLHTQKNQSDIVELRNINSSALKNNIQFAQPLNENYTLDNDDHILRSDSLKSYESYLEIPDPQEGKIIGRKKILRKEREGELYLMVFNSCQDLYTKLYKSHIIGGNTFLSLDRLIATSTEFAVEKVRQNPIHEWEQALKKVQKGLELQGEDFTVNQCMDVSTGFEFEWRLLRNRLHCNYLTLTHRLPSKFLRSILLFPACVEDLEQLLAYVDVHEELLENGGSSMETLFGKSLLNNYKNQIELAKLHTFKLKELYSENFKLAIVRHAAVLLINLKSELVKTHATKGLILEEDKIKILEILQEQQLKLTNYRQFFAFLKISTFIHTLVSNIFKKRQ